MLICSPTSTDHSHFHEPPSGSVNGSSSCKEQVSQANPVVEEPASASQEQGRNHSGDGSMETSEQKRLGVEESYGGHYDLRLCLIFVNIEHQPFSLFTETIMIQRQC